MAASSSKMECSHIDPQLTMDGDDVVFNSEMQRRIEDISHYQEPASNSRQPLDHAQVQRYPVQASGGQASSSVLHYLTPACFCNKSHGACRDVGRRERAIDVSHTQNSAVKWVRALVQRVIAPADMLEDAARSARYSQPHRDRLLATSRHSLSL